MTVFRSDTAPPAWCELEHFEIITLQRDADDHAHAIDAQPNG